MIISELTIDLLLLNVDIHATQEPIEQKIKLLIKHNLLLHDSVYTIKETNKSVYPDSFVSTYVQHEQKPKELILPQKLFNSNLQKPQPQSSNAVLPQQNLKNLFNSNAVLPQQNLKNVSSDDSSSDSSSSGYSSDSSSSG
jgi:hypothetical protein